MCSVVNAGAPGEAVRVARRTGTVVFGLAGEFVVASATVWALTGTLEQSWADDAGGGAVFGALACLVFRVTIWPAVVMRPDAVVVRNPVVDHTFVGGSPRLVAIDLRWPVVSDGEAWAPVFALSGSMLDQLTGSRTTEQLTAALVARPPSDRPVAHHRDRSTLARHAVLFLAGGALFGVLIHLAASLG